MDDDTIDQPERTMADVLAGHEPGDVWIERGYTVRWWDDTRVTLTADPEPDPEPDPDDPWRSGRSG